MKFLNSNQQFRDICQLEWLGNESNQEHINISLAKGIIFVEISPAKGITFVEISLANGIIFTKMGLANGTILKLWAAHPYLKFSLEPPREIIPPSSHKNMDRILITEETLT